MITTCLTALLFTFLLQSQVVQSTVSWTITSTMPSQVMFPRGGNSITLLMQADVALTKCQCRTISNEANYEPLIDLSQGHQSAVYTAPGNRYTASYSGKGLKDGQCGLELSNKHIKRRLLVCRAHPNNGPWQYQQVTLLDPNDSQHNMTTQPCHLVLPGNTALMTCQTYKPLHVCSFRLPVNNDSIKFFESDQATPQGRLSYVGKGVQHGDCGVAISNTSESDTGLYWCWGRTASDNLDSYLPTMLLIAAPPTSTVLSLSSDASFTSGDTLTATCSVSASRPVANITWLLGDQVIRQDHVDDLMVPDPDWSWPWDKKSITQTLVCPLYAEDYDKEVVCRVTYLKLSIMKKQRITVKDNCGKKGLLRKELVAGGELVEAGEHPWHAGIYIKKGALYEQHCGGTLVTPRMIISAGHCFWASGKQTSHTKYKVGLGKVHRSWDVVEIGEQKMDIKQVHLRPGYSQNSNSLYQDISLVILKVPVILSSTVNTACIDQDNSVTSLQMAAGILGIATGWGWTESGKHSDTLRSIALPWVPSDTCWLSLPTKSQKYLTADKFCAGYVNASKSVCPGDSGGGLLFQDKASGRYFLQGIVSSSFSPRDYDRQLSGCYSQYFTGFTKISVYRQWIKDNTPI